MHLLVIYKFNSIEPLVTCKLMYSISGAPLQFYLKYKILYSKIRVKPLTHMSN